MSIFDSFTLQPLPKEPKKKKKKPKRSKVPPPFSLLLPPFSRPLLLLPVDGSRQVSTADGEEAKEASLDSAEKGLAHSGADGTNTNAVLNVNPAQHSSSAPSPRVPPHLALAHEMGGKRR